MMLGQEVLSLFLVAPLALVGAGPYESAADVVPRINDDTVTRFDEFAKAFGKTYGDDFKHRLSIFAQNIAFIEDFNTRHLDLKLAVNQFADLTLKEFEQTHLTGLSSAGASDEIDSKPFDPMAVVPNSVDWRLKGAVTPVKDQRNCGACWAFSATGAIEGAWFLAKGKLVSLSEEELVDCSKNGGNKGCSGGEPAAAFEWVAKSGICSEQAYPYTAFQDECHNQFFPCPAVVSIKQYRTVQSNNEAALKVAVAAQPISVEIQANTDLFRFYKSGILKDDGCGTFLDHAVLAVGYGASNGQDYWLVKNSWNETWGERGYVRLARTNSTWSSGQCGIAKKASYPVVDADAGLLV